MGISDIYLQSCFSCMFAIFGLLIFDAFSYFNSFESQFTYNIACNIHYDFFGNSIICSMKATALETWCAAGSKWMIIGSVKTTRFEYNIDCNIHTIRRQLVIFMCCSFNMFWVQI